MLDVVSLSLVHHAVGVRVKNVVMIFITEVVCFVVRGIHLLMILIRTHSTTRPTTHHTHTSKNHIIQNYFSFLILIYVSIIRFVIYLFTGLFKLSRISFPAAGFRLEAGFG